MQQVISQARDWNIDDPVSTLYEALFGESSFIDHGLTPEQLLADVARRHTYRIPPGYKDAGKEDGGVGDVDIWHSILALGARKKCDVTFVTDDEKADWMVRTGKEGLYPRPELVAEFYEVAGKTFCAISFERFLGFLGALGTTVEAVKSASDSVRKSLGSRYGRPAEAIGDMLGMIEMSIEDYLSSHDSDEGQEEFEYIREAGFQDLVSDFCNRWRTEAEKWRLPRGIVAILIRIEGVLTRMVELNGVIHYAEVRMKESAIEEQEQLNVLAVEFKTLRGSLPF